MYPWGLTSAGAGQRAGGGDATRPGQPRSIPVFEYVPAHGGNDLPELPERGGFRGQNLAGTWAAAGRQRTDLRALRGGNPLRAVAGSRQHAQGRRIVLLSGAGRSRADVRRGASAEPVGAAGAQLRVRVEALQPRRVGCDRADGAASAGRPGGAPAQRGQARSVADAEPGSVAEGDGSVATVAGHRAVAGAQWNLWSPVRG